MALIKCTKCGNPTSDKAKVCPKCNNEIVINNSMEQQDNTSKESTARCWFMFLMGFFLFIGGVFALLTNSAEKIGYFKLAIWLIAGIVLSIKYGKKLFFNR